MTKIQTPKQTTLNWQTDKQTYLLLATVYALGPMTLDCSFTLVLQSINTQPYTDGIRRANRPVPL